MTCTHVDAPTRFVNGKSDVMVPTINSFALFEQPPDARLILCPDSGHGALFQYAEAFVREGLRFLAAADPHAAWPRAHCCAPVRFIKRPLKSGGSRRRDYTKVSKTPSCD